MTYADIYARDLANAGWSYGFASYVTRDGRRMVAADAPKNGVRFVVHANSLRMALQELESETLVGERENQLGGGHGDIGRLSHNLT